MARAALALLAFASSAFAAQAASAPLVAGAPILLARAQSLTECRRLVPDYTALCTLASFADGQMEIGRQDINRDGHLDLVVRRQSSLQCGSHGCSTEVYFRRHGKYVRGDPPLISAGPIYRCRTSKSFGLQMTTGSGRGPCIEIK